MYTSVYGTPYGYGGTEKWLKAVGEALGASVAPEVTSQLQEKKKEAMTFRMYASMYRNKDVYKRQPFTG